jgi:uncharacterized protein
LTVDGCIFFQLSKNMVKAEKRSYRNLIHQETLKTYRTVVKETDLYVHAKTDLTELAAESVLRLRGYIEAYIIRFPEFLSTLSPWPDPGPCPKIIRDMVDAGKTAGVGPMAAVAGAIAERVGRDLLRQTDEVIIENGGDTFIKTHCPVSAGIYAGGSLLSLRVGLRIDSSDGPVSVCTSSGTVGHSLSFGKADAVCVKSASCALADAAATAIGNRVKKASDIPDAVEFGKKIPGVEGLVVIFRESMGMWGNLEVIPLKGKKP